MIMKNALSFLVITCLVLLSIVPDAEARGYGAARAQAQGYRAQMIQEAIAKRQLLQGGNGGGANRAVMVEQRRSRGVKFM